MMATFAIGTAGLAAGLVAGCGNDEPEQRTITAYDPPGEYRPDTGGADVPDPEASPEPSPERNRFERAAARLGPAGLAGLRMIAPVRDGVVPPEVEQAIGGGAVAGVVLFGEDLDPDQLALLTGRLQALPRPLERYPLLVMVDQEGGEIRRVAGPPAESAAELGSRGPIASHEAGLRTGDLLASAGINVDLAPVADVAGTGSDLAGDERAFGTSPTEVASNAAAFASGLQQRDVAATAKHFPGFGRAPANTDQVAVTIDAGRGALEEDMVPFSRLIDDGVQLVMLSSATYPALAEAPAAFSPAIAERLLRDELGFTGVSVTDDLEAGAVEAAIGSPDEAAIAATDAGVDLCIFALTPSAAAEAREAVGAAISSGRIDETGAEESAARILELRHDLGTS